MRGFSWLGGGVIVVAAGLAGWHALSGVASPHNAPPPGTESAAPVGKDHRTQEAAAGATSLRDVPDWEREAREILLGTSPAGPWNELAGHLSRWAQTAPKQCVAWISSNIPEDGQRRLLLEQAYSEWARHDPAEAFSAARDLAGEPSLLRAALAAWAEADPESAFEAYRACPDTLRMEISEAMILVTAGNDLRAMAADLLSDWDAFHKNEADVVRLGRALATVNREVAADWLSKRETDPQNLHLAAAVFGTHSPADGASGFKSEDDGSGADHAAAPPRGQREQGQEATR